VKGVVVSGGCFGEEGTTGVDDLDWFIEGLAVFASGRLTKDRLDQMQTAVAAGQTQMRYRRWPGPNR